MITDWNSRIGSAVLVLQSKFSTLVKLCSIINYGFVYTSNEVLDFNPVGLKSRSYLVSFANRCFSV